MKPRIDLWAVAFFLFAAAILVVAVVVGIGLASVGFTPIVK